MDDQRPGPRGGHHLPGSWAGAIVLLHDSDRFGPTGMARVARGALAPLAEELARRRLAAVTLDQLVEGDGP